MARMAVAPRIQEVYPQMTQMTQMKTDEEIIKKL
jgi:hypothetical protein